MVQIEDFHNSIFKGPLSITVSLLFFLSRVILPVAKALHATSSNA